MRLSRAVDMWMGELARGGRTAGTRASYERYIPLEDVHAYAARTDRETEPAKRWRRWLPKREGEGP